MTAQPLSDWHCHEGQTCEQAVAGFNRPTTAEQPVLDDSFIFCHSLHDFSSCHLSFPRRWNLASPTVAALLLPRSLGRAAHWWPARHLSLVWFQIRAQRGGTLGGRNLVKPKQTWVGQQCCFCLTMVFPLSGTVEEPTSAMANGASRFPSALHTHNDYFRRRFKHLNVKSNSSCRTGWRIRLLKQQQLPAHRCTMSD